MTTTDDGLVSIDSTQILFTPRNGAAPPVSVPLGESPYRVASNGLHTVVVTSAGGVFHIEGRTARELARHGAGKADVTYVAAAGLFASTGRDGKVDLWSPGGELVHQFVLGRTCGKLAVSGTTLAAICNRNIIAVLDVPGRRVLLRREMRHETYGVALSADGRHAAVSSVDGYVYVWNLSSASLAIATGAVGVLTSVTFSPDGSKIAVSSNAGRVHVWRMAALRFVPDAFEEWVAGATDVSIDPSFVSTR
jgi:WD40 repeat protein